MRSLQAFYPLGRVLSCLGLVLVPITIAYLFNTPNRRSFILRPVSLFARAYYEFSTCLSTEVVSGASLVPALVAFIHTHPLRCISVRHTHFGRSLSLVT